MSESSSALSVSEHNRNFHSKKACRMQVRATRLVSVLTKDEPHGSSPWLATFAELKALVPPGVYELHKSTSADLKLYTVLGVGDHTENKGEFLVACIAHYLPHKGNLCFRPLLGEGGFLTPVRKMTHEDPAVEYYVPRFKFLTHLPQSFERFVELSTG